MRIACTDWCIVAFLLFVALASGVFYLFVQPIRLHDPSYLNQSPGDCAPNLAVCVMLATGRGFAVPLEGDDASASYPDAPKLVKFLRREITHLTPDQIPDGLRTCKPRCDWDYRHRFLVYTIGALWRLFGISWHVVTALRVAMFCAMIGAIYGLMRLGMGRLCSIATTLILALTPLIIGVNLNVRDFGKGPFILTAMLILGWLIKFPLRRVPFFGLAALLGLVIGVGFGFRADLLICLLPALFVLAFCRRACRGFAVGERLVAMALLMAAFYAPASLIMGVYGGGSLFAHDVLMGFATNADDMLGINRASYEKIYIKHDLFVAGAAADYCNRSLPSGAAPEVSTDERPLLLQMARTFPGDLLTRGYSAVLWVLRGRAASVPLAVFMTVCTAVALLIIASRDLRMAWMALLVLLYFCGYTSLQTEVRHAFHLIFIPLWMVGFLLDKLIFLGRKFVVAVFSKDGPKPSGRGWKSPAKRMVQFALSAVVLLFVPLQAARAYQDAKLGGLLDACETADLIPVEVKTRPLDGWTMLDCGTPPPPHSGLPVAPRGFNVEYWVAEFAPSAEWRRIWLQYEIGTLNPSEDWFCHGLWVAPGGKNDSGNMKYFFPVVEQSRITPGRWALFAGIALPENQAGDFRGLYKVRNTRDFPLFLNVAYNGDRASFRSHQTLYGETTARIDAEAARFWIDRMPLYRIPSAGDILGDNETEEAVKTYKGGLAVSKDDARLRLGLAACLESRSDKETALAAYREALSADPQFFVPYHYIDDFFRRHGEMADRIAFWKETARDHPDNYLPQFHLAMALVEAHDVDDAIAAYRKVMELNPDDSGTLADIGGLLLGKNEVDAAIDAYQRALQIDPLDIQAVHSLNALLARRQAS